MSAPGEGALFPFVQFEFAGVLGPVEGRFVLRSHAGEDASHVLVINRLDGKPAWAPLTGSGVPGRRERKVREAPPDPELPVVPAVRTTVIRVRPFEDFNAGRDWLSAHEKDSEKVDEVVDEAAAIVNRALHSHAAASADPRGRLIAREEALIVRVGYGRGEQVSEGRWEAAVKVPAISPNSKKKRGRTAVLKPQERLAAILGGREVLLACETLAVRARADLDGGRTREAAMQAHLALEAAVAELAAWREVADLGKRVTELETYREGLAEAANRALEGGLDEPTTEAVRKALQRVEAALRARIASVTF